jgi:hypothetical protein
MTIQQDRDFAAALAVKVYGQRVAAAIKNGETDWHHFVTAFREHRMVFDRKAIEDSWRNNPDRMGGSFSDREIIDSMRKDW